MHAVQSEYPERFACEPIPSALLARAKQTFDAIEFLDGVRETEATGGQTLESLIEEVEAQVRRS